MIRYLISAFAFGLLVAAPAHGQQGNMPAPTEKLPSYPPAVCVTPDWNRESCEGRKDSTIWQCGNVRVNWSSDRTNLGNFSTEFLLTGIEQRTNRFKLVQDDLYLNGKRCTSFPKDKPSESDKTTSSSPAPATIPLPRPRPLQADYAGTYYEPGTYFPELTDSDKVFLSSWDTMPPVEYDHPFDGRLRVIDVGTVENVRRLCNLTMPYAAFPLYTFKACGIRRQWAVLDWQADCVIFHTAESEIQRMGHWNITMRHELGHNAEPSVMPRRSGFARKTRPDRRCHAA